MELTGVLEQSVQKMLFHLCASLTIFGVNKAHHHEHDTAYTGCHDISRSCVFDVEQDRFERQTARGTGRVSKSRGVVFYKRIGTRSSEKTRLRDKDIL